LRKERAVVILPESATDSDIIAAVEAWLSLLEREDYVAACAAVDSPPGGVWTPEILRSCVNYHGFSERSDHRVTLTGVVREQNIDGRIFVATQRKDVERYEPNDGGEVIEIWYDLFVDGVLSDLTATFRLVRVPLGLRLRLYDICVR
jgi:hypothetical protein